MGGGTQDLLPLKQQLTTQTSAAGRGWAEERYLSVELNAHGERKKGVEKGRES